MYRSAFLGCGPRARQHADAYRFVKQGKMVAICDLDEKQLDAFSKEFNIRACYTDIRAMLGKERPDLLHIVTPPGLRVPLMSIAPEYEVPVVIIEKPIAIQPEGRWTPCLVGMEVLGNHIAVTVPVAQGLVDRLLHFCEWMFFQQPEHPDKFSGSFPFALVFQTPAQQGEPEKANWRSWTPSDRRRRASGASHRKRPRLP